MAIASSSSAFPSTTHTAEGNHVNMPEFGLTKREYFAAMALQGLVGGVFGVGFLTPSQIEFYKSHLPGLAIEIADKTIEALNAN